MGHAAWSLSPLDRQHAGNDLPDWQGLDVVPDAGPAPGLHGLPCGRQRGQGMQQVKEWIRVTGVRTPTGHPTGEPRARNGHRSHR
jgi:hypothetical protein